MQTSDARKAGESEERLHMVQVWREASNFFTEPELAALGLTEAVTLVSGGGVPDEVYARDAEHFTDPELAHLLSTAKIPGTDERAAV